MKKEKIIKRYGEATYKKMLQQNRDRQAINPNKVKANSRESCHKGGKYYEHKLKYMTTGLQGERGRVRAKHAKKYRPFKRLIAPKSQIHHEWLSGTAKYTGVALVETDQHMHGYIDVIKILEGKITLLTEKEVREK